MRKFWVALMTIGYPMGNILAALILSPLLKTHSWRVVFELGAGATAAMIPGGVVLRAGVRFLAVPQTAGQCAGANQWRVAPHGACRDRLAAAIERRAAEGAARRCVQAEIPAAHVAAGVRLFRAHHVVLLHPEVGGADHFAARLFAVHHRRRAVLGQRRWRNGWRDPRTALAAHEPHLAHEWRAGPGHDLNRGFRHGPGQSCGPQGHRRCLRLLHECRHRRPVHAARAGLSDASASHRHGCGHRRGARRRGAGAHSRGLSIPAGILVADRVHHHGLRFAGSAPSRCCS